MRQVGLAGFKDPALLKWAAQNGRTVVTHDIKTMRPFAEQLLQRGEPMAGLILVPENLGIGRAIHDLELTIACHLQSELRDRIEHLPL